MTARPPDQFPPVFATNKPAEGVTVSEQSNLLFACARRTFGTALSPARTLLRSPSTHKVGGLRQHPTPGPSREIFIELSWPGNSAVLEDGESRTWRNVPPGVYSVNVKSNYISDAFDYSITVDLSKDRFSETTSEDTSADECRAASYAA